MKNSVKLFTLILFIVLGLSACSKCGTYKKMACNNPESEECKNIDTIVKGMSSDQCADKIMGLKAEQSFDD